MTKKKRGITIIAAKESFPMQLGRYMTTPTFFGKLLRDIEVINENFNSLKKMTGKTDEELRLYLQSIPWCLDFVVAYHSKFQKLP